MSKLVEGFIYTRAGTPCSYTRAEWREQAARLMADGGFIRQEFGETFIHNKNGEIVAEIYAQGVLSRAKASSRSGTVDNVIGPARRGARLGQTSLVVDRAAKRKKV